MPSSQIINDYIQLPSLRGPCTGWDHLMGVLYWINKSKTKRAVALRNELECFWWNADDLAASTYVWLPLRFENDQLHIEWHDEWDLSYFDTN